MATNLDPSKKLVTMAVHRELLKSLADYRFANRFPSVSAAIRALVVEGLVKHGTLQIGADAGREAPGPEWEPVILAGVITGWSTEL
jgi:hypothetical protein